MSYKILIQTNTSNPRTIVELSQIGGDITAPTFGNITNGNIRLHDAQTLLSRCSDYINQTVKPAVPPSVLFIYRGVAVGGLQRNLGGFSAKPLTVKNKSIDPTLLKGNSDFERLTGLVPIQTKLGKNGDKNDTSLIGLATGQAGYFITKVEDVGNTKSYLCCSNNDRILSWESSMNTSNKTLCTFLGDASNPYLADWDLVTVGVTKNSVKKDSTVSTYYVKDKPTPDVPHNILPQWLDDCLTQQQTPFNSHVTQHGPESLYCGNNIKSPGEEFLILFGKNGSASQYIISASSSEKGDTPFDKLRSYLASDFGSYLLYEFPNFDGSGTTKPSDYNTAVSNFNNSNFK